MSPQHHIATYPINLIFPNSCPVFVQMHNFYVTVSTAMALC